MIKQPSNRLSAIQGLRAYAAILVVIPHAINTYSDKVLNLDVSYIPAGDLGVKIFFCISGFIIYTISGSLEKGWANFSLFMRKRFIRIAPIYWIATSIYFIKLILQGEDVGYIDLLKSMFFIPYLNHHGLMQPVLGQGWTLNFEMFFYLIFGVSILFTTHKKLWLVSLALLAFCLMQFLLPSPEKAEANSLYSSLYFFINIDFLAYFIAGMIVASVRKMYPVLNKIHEVVAMLMVTVFLSIFLFADTYLQQIQFPASLKAPIFAFGCFIVCVFVVENESHEHESLFSRFLHLCGDASYSIYLFHGFILGVSARLIAATHVNVSQILYLLAMIFLCLIAGIISYNFIEKPIIKKLNSIFL